MSKQIKIENRSRRTQEAYADYLMKVSSSLLIAFLVAILIVPISVILSSIFNSTIHDAGFIGYLKQFMSIKWIVFGVFEYFVFWIADNYRNRALEIYDSL